MTTWKSTSILNRILVGRSEQICQLASTQIPNMSSPVSEPRGHMKTPPNESQSNFASNVVSDVLSPTAIAEISTGEKLFQSVSGISIDLKKQKNGHKNGVKRKRESQQDNTGRGMAVFKKNAARFLYRKSTLRTAAIRAITTEKIQNPTYTNEDEAKKVAIFGNNCVQCGSDEGIGKGDHAVETKGDLKKLGVVGVNDKFNLMRVCSKCNAGGHYKKLKVNGKNVIDNLFVQTMPPGINDSKYAQKIAEWKEWCGRRGAKLFHKLTKEDYILLESVTKIAEKGMRQIIHDAEKLFTK